MAARIPQYADGVQPAKQRIYLSAPTATDEDIEAVAGAMRSGWLAPIGPDLTGFEADMAAYLEIDHAVALSSGSAALHLGMKALGVSAGDVVLVPTVTFGATAFAVTYLGAEPVFIDIDASWNMDPALLPKAIEDLRASGTRIGAALPVDLYGSPANYSELLPIFEAHDIPVLEDAAEGLGASHGCDKLATFGRLGVLSFNGNKLITTSGGGMVVTDEPEIAERIRFWSTQSRDSFPWYEHSEIGYNYRLSNLLAALGRSQLRRVDQEVTKRRAIREWYRERLEAISGVTVQSDPEWGRSNAWLTVVRFDTTQYPNAPTRIRERLAEHNIESRPIWKPMHQQPVFRSQPAFLTGRADALFSDGLCLPSGTALDQDDVDRVSQLTVDCLR